MNISSRAQLEWTHRFPFLAKSFAKLPNLIMDGQVVSLTEIGASDFGKLQADLKNGDHNAIVFLAFDFMYFRKDLTSLTLTERKRALRSIVYKTKSDRIFYSEPFDDGVELYKQAEKLGLEGIVSKQASSIYKPSKLAWLEVKCQRTDELTIGFVPGGW